MGLSPENEEQGSGLSRDHAHAASDAMEWIFVVMATSGEWSDRSEWPICAVTSEDAARGKVEELTDRVAAARALAGDSPDYGTANDAAWTAYWTRKDAATATLEDIGGSDLDLSFFTHKVPFSSASLGEGEGSRDTPEPSSPPEDERSKLSGGWEPIAFLIERDGPGYGKARKVVLLTEYDPRQPDFWVNDEKPDNYTVTPLFEALRSTSEGGVS